jgi:hypothetical protein
MPPDPAAVVQALRACRAVMVDVCGRVKPIGPIYHGASMVMAAIDGFAAVLTGQRHYFYAGGSTMSQGGREALEDQDAREKGEKPWEP